MRNQKSEKALNTGIGFLSNLEGLAEAGWRGASHLVDLQKSDGDWEGEMVWCTMILAQAVIVRTVVGKPYTEEERLAIIRQFAFYQRPDGSWGMHPESEGYVFFTTLAYVALRLLGLTADEALTAKALKWLHAQSGGVMGIPTWGKFWLAILDLYSYEGLNSVPPELFIVPEWLAFHPRHFYCHTRLIYLGLAYLSGSRFVAKLPGTLRDELRQELYTGNYDTINFAANRHNLAQTDVYIPISPVLRKIYDGLAIYERHPFNAVRKKALEACYSRILQEQRLTRFQGVSPVNGLLNCLAIYAHDSTQTELTESLQALEAWRWEDDLEGIRYVGARSNTWDTAFAIQALCEMPDEFRKELKNVMQRALRYLQDAQEMEEISDYRQAWRDPSRGGWCFSNGEHRWQVSDCTAEALAAILAVEEIEAFDEVSSFDPDRMAAAVEFILLRQNADGGFGTYERRRGGKFLEAINPSEMFGQCMTELSYVECTASALAALSHYLRHYPEVSGGKITTAMNKALAFLRKCQLADGSYPGFWGINYTYATFHVVKGMRMAGVASEDASLQAAGRWLLEKQRSDGGWGEHYTSCLQGKYIESQGSQVVMTSWALLALMDILAVDHPAIVNGIEWLQRQQLDNGDWPNQGVNGVFFGAAMLDYRLYHTYFPVWALARYLRLSSTAKH